MKNNQTAQEIIDEVSEEMEKKYDVIKLEKELLKNEKIKISHEREENH